MPMIALGRVAAVSASLAVFGMVASPVAAAQLPVAPAATHEGALHYDAEAGNADGWRYPRYRRHSGAHIRTGDAIAGIAILGAVAAIASAANNADRTRTREVYREPPVRDRDYNYRDGRSTDRRSSSWDRNGGINSAVDLCVNQVERGDDRVDAVDEAIRDGSGWRVQGRLGNGDNFTCRLDNEGRIRAIDIGDGYAAYDATAPALSAEGQLSDEAYRSARASTRTPIDEKPGANSSTGYDHAAAPANEPQPAYPGGPLPGEEGVDADLLGG
jgi:hypothetical protein